MIKTKVVGFGFIGNDATLGDGYGIWEHFHSFREVKCLYCYLKYLWMGTRNIKTLSNNSRIWPNSCVCGLLFKKNAVRFLIAFNLRFRFYEVCVQKQWGCEFLWYYWSYFNCCYSEILSCFSGLMLWNLYGKSMRERQEALFCNFFLSIKSALIIGGWWLVEWVICS